MDLGQAFSYPTRDPEWFKKIGIIALVNLIPIVGQLVMLGWVLEITRRTIRRDTILLPDVDFSTQLSDGFKAGVVGFVYALPVILVQGISQGIMIAVENGSGSSDATIQVMSFAVICMSCVVGLYGLVLGVFLPAVYGRMAVDTRIGAGFDVGKIFGLLQSAPGAYLLLIVGSIVAGILASLGVIACLIGVLFTSAYANAVMANLYGQAYLQATQPRAL